MRLAAFRLCFPAAAYLRAKRATDERSDMALAVQRNDSPRRPQPPPRRWEPFNELEQFERLIDRVWSTAGAGGAAPWIPLADIEETDDPPADLPVGRSGQQGSAS